MTLGGRGLRPGALAWLVFVPGFFAPATVALAQQLGTSAATEVPWWRVVGALTICLLLAVAAAFSLKWKLAKGPSPLPAPAWASRFTESIKTLSGDARRLRLVETLRLSHQIDICLIRCEDREYVVAASPQGGYLIDSHDVKATKGEGL